MEAGPCPPGEGGYREIYYLVLFFVRNNHERGALEVAIRHVGCELGF